MQAEVQFILPCDIRTPAPRWTPLPSGVLPMRRCFIPLFAAGLLAAACTSMERTVVSAPQFAHVQDLDGTPDLIVDSKDLATSWVVYDQELKESFCTLQEGGVPPGTHRVLRFTVTTPNIGDADIAIGIPTNHWDRNAVAKAANPKGRKEKEASHAHFTSANYRTNSSCPAAASR